jgi:hypothetical protein
MKYDSWVTISEIIPPIGEKRFAANAQIHEIGKGKIEHGLGEVWSETKDEAEKKMQEKIDTWLKQNP